MLEKALQYAKRVHDPGYLPHPIQVSENLRDIGKVSDDELLTTALLHDTLEWGSGDLSEIKEEFGERIAELVNQLTRTEPDNKDYSRKELSKLRHKLLMADIDVMTDDAKQIKLADRLTNLRERIENEPPDKVEKYKAKTKDLLTHIDREVNPPLWDAIEKLLT